MGMARWSPADWDTYVAYTKTKSASEIFSSDLCDDLDPLHIDVRESRDSELNPCSTPIIVAVDNTGSMGFLAENLIRRGLGVLIEEIYQRKPVADPHVMCMAVGDAWCDRAPLQVTQFEADIRLAQQLSRLYIEGGGGGNEYESYNLPWYFAAVKTKCDSMLKRKKKGYLFTVGDEPPPPVLKREHARRFLGTNLAQDMPTTQLLALVSRHWQVFHIMIEEGSYFRSAGKTARERWQALIGQRALALSDHRNLAELIVSTIQVSEGQDAATVAASWSGDTALVVRKSLLGLPAGARAGSGVTRL